MPSTSRTPTERARAVDALRARADRLARLSCKLTAEGRLDEALLVCDEALDCRRRADAEINSWAEARPARRTA